MGKRGKKAARRTPRDAGIARRKRRVASTVSNLGARPGRGASAADKLWQFDVCQAEAAETTYIPTEGPLAQLGAAAYLAVLAYPNQSEWPKRDGFIEAVKAILLKSWVKAPGVSTERTKRRCAVREEYRQFPPEDIWGKFNQVEKRIKMLRLPAMICAHEFEANGAVRAAFLNCPTQKVLDSAR